jgi:hypothetical protein
MALRSDRRGILVVIVAATATATACGSTAPTAPTPPSHSNTETTWTLDREKVVAALDYWREAAGITYVLIDQDEGPRLLIRPGTDGLAPWGGGRGLVNGTAPDDNRATSGLVVIQPGGGSFCAVPTSQTCRSLYRHEIGHGLGFSGHSGLVGLMQSGSDQLHPRELAMFGGLYSLPHGARPSRDGTWHLAGTPQHGTLDPQVATDIIDWNMTPPSSYRRSDVISRWELPVRVYLAEAAVPR